MPDADATEILKYHERSFGIFKGFWSRATMQQHAEEPRIRVRSCQRRKRW
jgi:hypothetical protein